MKKFIFGLIAVLIMVVAVVAFLPKQQELKEYDYLRIHIRANSNLDADQQVKYEIKNEVVKFLTPYLSDVPTKSEAIDIVNNNKPSLIDICISKLRSKGFMYSVNIKVCNEYFPARTYNNTTLDSGFYDAVIVELGSATGDNWWCVMYPPLCFTKKTEGNADIKYKSRIWQWLKKVFN